jgi:signal transduction histidine kinase
LVEDYLAFSRSGPKELKRQRVSLENAVELARHELESAAAGRVVTWVIHPLPSVEGDASMLRQAFLNLLSNSLKFSRTRSETRIEVGVESDAPELVLFVRDNGIGFESSLAAELFNKFHRGDGADGFEGTGVGLTIVQHIIQRHGGRVWAEGLPDKGATFYVAFPGKCV